MDFLSTQEFDENARILVEDKTWCKGKPMYYRKDGVIVEHWKDGKIVVIDDVEKAWSWQQTTRDVDGNNILGELRKLNDEVDGIRS